MNKIDLIIDALENWQHSCLELGRCSSELGLSTEALAAARELKALTPMAWMLPEYGDVLPASQADGTGIYNIPLYIAPPKRDWVGLTDDEVFEFLSDGVDGREDINNIEEALRSKNT